MRLMMSPDVKNVIAKHKWTMVDFLICDFTSIFNYLKALKNKQNSKIVAINILAIRISTIT